MGEITVLAPPGNGDALGSGTVTPDGIRTFDRKTLGKALLLVPGTSVSLVGARNETDIWIRGFGRWLALFAVAADGSLPPEAAAKAKARAVHMTDSFRVGMFPYTGSDGRPSRLPPRT